MCIEVRYLPCSQKRATGEQGGFFFFYLSTNQRTVIFYVHNGEVFCLLVCFNVCSHQRVSILSDKSSEG